jgi:hypothetical protein
MGSYSVVDRPRTARRLARRGALTQSERPTTTAGEPAARIAGHAPQPQRAYPGIARLVCQVSSTPDPGVLNRLLQVIMNEISDDCPGTVPPARPDSAS